MNADTIEYEYENSVDMLQEARDRISEFEKLIEAIPGSFKGDHESCPLSHIFGDGICTREIFLPAGTTVVGKIHRLSHPNFILQGTVIVTSDRQQEPTTIHAPMYYFSPAGSRKVVHAVTDAVWVTVHPTDKRTPEELEDEIIAKSYNELPEQICKEIGL